METKFTPTQRRILAVLEDGYPHPLKELQGCIDDEFANGNTFSVHLSYLRKILRPRGEDIIAKHNGRGPAQYIWVRLRRKNSE